MDKILNAWWWVLVIVVAIMASGVIQWFKGFVKTKQTWIWGLLLPMLCLAIAAAFQPWPWLLALGVLAMCLAQIGYDTLLRGLLAWVARLQGPDIPVPPPAVPSA